MPFYKAKESYSRAKNTLDSVSSDKHKVLLEGGTIELTNFIGCPASLEGHLEEVKIKTETKSEPAVEVQNKKSGGKK